MDERVVVVGGGYGGITAASTLDDIADVTLVEPREAFAHTVAALRGLADPQWARRLFLPYDRLLRRGRVARDRAVAVRSAGTADPAAPAVVRLGSGEELVADAVVLATGSSYPFPAKFAETDTDAVVARLASTRAQVAAAGHVLLLGAGPVGVELAGEITSAWPGTAVTLLDPHPELLGGVHPAELAAELGRQLTGRGVRLLLGRSLDALPRTEPGRLDPFGVRADDGTTIRADLWFRCHGASPVADVLDTTPGVARTERGHVHVGPDLSVPGHPRVFAIGDVTDVPESKTAKAAGVHAGVVAATLRARITGAPQPDPYVPGPPSIVVPLGPDGGAAYSPATGLLDAATTVRIKGSHMRLDDYRTLLRLDEDAHVS